MARLGYTRINRAGGRSGGRSIGFRLKTQTRGFNELERRMRKLAKAGDWDAALRTNATSSMLEGKKPELQHRSAWDNARIWAKHREEGRNPFVYERKRGLALWAVGANKMLRQQAASMRGAAVDVAKYMLDAVEQRVSSGEGMTPLSDRYRKWKERIYPGRPILMLTTQLMKSLRPVAVEMT